MLIDSHAHFDMILKNRAMTEDEVFAGLAKHHVIRAVQVSTGPDGFSWSRDFAVRRRRQGILFSLGVHPSVRADEKDLGALEDSTAEMMSGGDAQLLFGIGACGLDFYRMREPEEMQMRSFEFQLDLAHRFSLPVIVHSRNAMERTIDLLWRKKPVDGIMHCFSGTRHEAGKLLDLGLHISFAGNITYHQYSDLQDTARYVPLDRLLVESNAPFLAPVPRRAGQNRPSHVRYVYRSLADLRGEPLSRVEKAVYENFMRLRR